MCFCEKLISVMIIAVMVISLSIVVWPSKTVFASEETVIVEGKVIHNKLETGFYEVDGHRLAGNVDFKGFLNKTVRIKGLIDNSPSIYMVKTLNVIEIEELSNVELDGEGTLETDGVLLYNEHNGLYCLSGMNLNWEKDLSPYYGFPVRIVGSMEKEDLSDSKNLLNVKSIEIISVEEIRQKAVSELDSAKKAYDGFLSSRQRLEDALYNKIAIDGSKAEISLYMELGQLLRIDSYDPSVFVNGKKLFWEQDILPFFEKERMIVSAKALADVLDAEIKFESGGKIIINKGIKNIVLYVDKTTAYVNGTKKPWMYRLESKSKGQHCLLDLCVNRLI